jgi:hypothetical protein
METKGSLRWSQELTTGLIPSPVYTLIAFLFRSYLISFSRLHIGFPKDLFPPDF